MSLSTQYLLHPEQAEIIFSIVGEPNRPQPQYGEDMNDANLFMQPPHNCPAQGTYIMAQVMASPIYCRIGYCVQIRLRATPEEPDVYLIRICTGEIFESRHNAYLSLEGNPQYMPLLDQLFKDMRKQEPYHLGYTLRKDPVPRFGYCIPAQASYHEQIAAI